MFMLLVQELTSNTKNKQTLLAQFVSENMSFRHSVASVLFFEYLFSQSIKLSYDLPVKQVQVDKFVRNNSDYELIRHARCIQQHSEHTANHVV